MKHQWHRNLDFFQPSKTFVRHKDAQTNDKSVQVIGAVLPTSLRTKSMATLIQAHCLRDRADQKVVSRSDKSRVKKNANFFDIAVSYNLGEEAFADTLSTLMAKPLQSNHYKQWQGFWHQRMRIRGQKR